MYATIQTFLFTRFTSVLYRILHSPLAGSVQMYQANGRKGAECPFREAAYITESLAG
ncbi:hypothetical protein GCM10025857_16830 [Alicyclobacillus contaminans]|nr:hypothetical protein GCM10025857_16830 [Alicyclobacillus contaminans]